MLLCQKWLNGDSFAPCSLSHLLTFVQAWLDEYSEDFREPPLHAPLRLLLDHLKISSAVHDTVCSQPTFCSLAAQAEELLRMFLKGSLTVFYCPLIVSTRFKRWLSLWKIRRGFWQGTTPWLILHTPETLKAKFNSGFVSDYYVFFYFFFYKKYFIEELGNISEGWGHPAKSSAGNWHVFPTMISGEGK